MSDSTGVKNIVFIDSPIADLQDLFNGLTPGGIDFALDSSRHGAAQIADLLAANGLTGLSATSIVEHGASGEIALGSDVLGETDLTQHSALLAKISTSLAYGGELQLYALAGGDAGQLADPLPLTGAGVTTATGLVGSADLGGSFAFDAAIGSIETAMPFAAGALSQFQGTLASTSASSDQAGSASNPFGGAVTGDAGMAGSVLVDDNSDQAINADLARTTFGVDGTGIKIGVLSDSFNVLGGYANDITDGALPNNVTILQEGPAGSSDEGRSMLELVHQVAPGAQLYFATADSTQQNFADDITALQNAGCNIILDDFIYFAEPFYQLGDPIENAIDSFVNAGGSYFTMAFNDGNGFYESAFNPISFNLPGVGTKTVHDFGGGNPYEQITLANDFGTTNVYMEWSQPFASIGLGHSSNDSLSFYVFDASHNFLFSVTTDQVGSDPVQGMFLNDLGGAARYIAVADDFGPAPDLFKMVVFGDGNGSVLGGPGNGVGSGTITGHNLDPNATTVAAVDYTNTPRFGVNPPVVEDFSGFGPGELLFDANGDALSSPEILNKPDLAAPDGSKTDPLNPFFGTSAATPNAGAVAALMLQARGSAGTLTSADIRNLLQDSAIPMADSDSSGAGLIQADKAVGFASTLTISNSDQTTLLGTHLADTISGSSANDTLEGFAGNDIIDGGAGGRDIAAFTGDKSDYTIERHLDRSVTVTDTRASSPDGADTLTQISTLQFSDSSVSIDPNAPAIAIGTLDMMTANETSNNVDILLGDGHGGFAAAAGSPVAVGSFPLSVALGDLNGDGVLDMVVANVGSDNVSVMLGDGHSGFTAASGSPVAVGSEPSSVALGDLDGDGHLDIVAANNGSNTISVLLGNGNGGFAAAAGSPLAVGLIPLSVALGDLDGNGNLDIVTADFNSNAVSVLLGNGAGGFTAAPGSPVAVGTGPRSVALGDLNGDGNLDIVTADSNSNTVSVLLGDGAGGFAAAAGSPVAVGLLPSSVALGDLNGDGSLDVVTANAGSNNVSVLLGDGNGGFAPAAGSPVAIGSQPSSVALGDLDGNGHLDIVAANSNSNNVSVLLGDGTGGFTAASPAATAGTGPASVALGYLDTAQTTNEDTPLVFSAARNNAIVISDADGDNQMVTLSAGHGKLTLSGTSGLTFSSGGNGQASMTFSGTLAAINTALTGLTYLSDLNYNGADALAITSSDGLDQTHSTAPITLNAVNDRATAEPDAVATNEATVLTGNLFADNGQGPDNDPEGDPFSVTKINGVAVTQGTPITLASGALLTITNVATGAFTYDPNHKFDYLPDSASGASNLTRDDIFDYTITGGSTARATVTISGLDSNDSVQDTFFFPDILRGGIGNDAYYVEDTADQVIENPGEGRDVVYAYTNYTIPDNVETLVLMSLFSDDPPGGFTGTGNAVSNAIVSVGNHHNMIGLGGNDFYYVHNIGDIVIEDPNEGSDVVYSTIDYTIPNNVESLFMVGRGLTGTGSSNNDMLGSVGGPNTLIGLGGNDAYYVHNAGDVVQESAGGGSDVVYATVSYTISANVETLVMVGSGLTGTGSAGNDMLASSGGPNTLVGLGGNDAYYVNNLGDQVVEAGGGGSDVVYATVNYTIPANVETLVMVGSGLTGTGSAGNDALGSSRGPNTLVGLGGNDAYYVNNAGDHVTEAAGAGSDVVYATVNYTIPANVETLVMVGSGLTGTGSAGNDVLGSSGGHNTLIGLGGNDTYYVHNSADVVKEAPGGGTRDTVVASVNYTLPVGSAVEVLMTSNTGGTAGLHLTGNALAQTILGDAGANVINGAAGNDTLEGLGGNDTFYFNTALNATTNVDRIIDFTHGADKIELDHAIFTALAVANPLPSADFTTGTPTNPNQHIIYNTTTGALSYDDDGSGVHTAMQFATLANHAALTSADIFVV